ncbi:hypothetical protein [Sphingomonas hankyongi]|uniref:Uncharacterized protein n=1 Tax=Sphingomonas hankyongi TaxID=2908209 RepID=A0ABT0S107_9SPHN|nr:hypothetical protein [Sphingomonas hankyongi]MCL6729496.1 hypothetical protein [Sphingomonas hankyongi]
MTDKPTIYDQPSKVRALNDAVEVSGPDDVDVAMTPDAAEETSERLLSASFEARGKKRFDKLPHRARD